MRILAATDFSTRSNRALRQAGLLAGAGGAQLDIVHVVDDDRPQQMLEMETREAEQILAEQTNAMAELSDVACHPVVVVGDPFDAILRTAEAAKADLIVMGQPRRQLLRDILVGTTIERVIRAGSFPVLMVNNEAQQRYERILIAVDLSEPSVNAILVARKAGLLSGSHPTLVHAFEAPARGKMLIANAERTTIDSYVEQERQKARAELVACLAVHGLEREQWPMLVEEGGAWEILARTVARMRPDLILMGTCGRSGIVKVLLGSVTEEALRSLDVDILVVPPER